MILEELKRKTSANHIQLEQSPLLQPISAQTLTKEDYIKILQKFYGYFYPLENLLNQFPELKTYLPDYDSRRKAAWLYRDLNHISGTASALQFLPLSEDLPGISTLSQAFGCLYVMEGSTLGGKQIAKVVKDRLGWDAAGGAAFFNGYGDQTGHKWKQFREALADFSSCAQTGDKIIEAANETFCKFEQWMNKP